ncbi:unnamed protein product [Ranitomeya imitator]|uniref:Uncharacterized protein n=1 Tax=Ranitomeya imitator TaxID=111125 RepID=A0ABN9LQM1_9NEOB|nr:unnamed protein product [Ranitomeya imitator]
MDPRPPSALQTSALCSETMLCFRATLARRTAMAEEPPKEDLTVSEKFQLVLDVAQKAQNLFGKMADILEKIKKLIGLCIGLYAGIKFFLIDFVFKRCPRLRDKYDTPYIIWTNLPTDPQLKERTNVTASRRVSIEDAI